MTSKCPVYYIKNWTILLTFKCYPLFKFVSQYPPNFGPILLIYPDSFSLARYFSTVLGVLSSS